MKRALTVAAAVLLLVVLAGAAMLARTRQSASAASPSSRVVGGSPGSRAPDSVRIRVQVLNTTKTRGLARRATQLLRDRGFDVVELGTSSPMIDTTMVLDLSGHPAWAEAAAKVMTPARTRSRPDSSRYLDVTVLIGSAWRPPAEPLYP